MATTKDDPEPAPDQLTIPQEPAENLGTELLLAGQEGNAPLPPEREPVDNLGLDELLGVDGQAAAKSTARKGE
jgi:hypothetical protein